MRNLINFPRMLLQWLLFLPSMLILVFAIGCLLVAAALSNRKDFEQSGWFFRGPFASAFEKQTLMEELQNAEDDQELH